MDLLGGLNDLGTEAVIVGYIYSVSAVSIDLLILTRIVVRIILKLYIIIGAVIIICDNYRNNYIDIRISLLLFRLGLIYIFIVIIIGSNDRNNNYIGNFGLFICLGRLFDRLGLGLLILIVIICDNIYNARSNENSIVID